MNDEIRQFVRERANYSCEYCGVSETDSGGELTIDHFKPQSKNGSDEKENLVYACVRCNLYKSDYYPETETDKELWNPRFETSENHFVELPNGKLFALTDTGVFTIKLLRLNRNPLVNYRVKKQKEIENRILLESYRNVLEILRKTLEKQRF
ncbi:MAG TPA: HNH endonuclease signature motif containing protein, partial [Pyrinomonadaceae bacterium]|nr:HNH endonuclease signature motif containing protein [Pyrinomonadaceae bacterium]